MNEEETELRRKRKSVSFNLNGIELRKMSRPILNNSVLDSKPGRILNFPLTVKQQLWLSFFLPAVFSCIIYMIDLATDLTVGIELLRENHIWAGTITLVITYIAPFICYIMELINPPIEQDFPYIINWFLIETGAFLVYPIRPLYCFGERLFWAVESLRLKDPNREEALASYEDTKTFKVENYGFIQGLLHSGPQAIFQLTLLMWHVSKHTHTEIFQSISVITSLLTLSLTATCYQRYETQAKGGRKRIWLKKPEVTDEEPDVLLVTPGASASLPKRRVWTKIMEEDNPLGKLVCLIFWFFFLLGRVLALTVAATFFPWAVLGVCIAHYIFVFLYILPSPNFKTDIWKKFLLSFVFIFCLIEVGIQFRKSSLFYTLFFIFSVVENLCLTLLWVFWAKWDKWWNHYVLYLLASVHIFAFIFISIYVKYFKPRTVRISPRQ